MGHFDSREDLAGEYPFGDLGQLLFLCLFLLVWVLDSFILKLTTVGVDYIPLLIRLPVSLFILALGLYLVKTSHDIIFGPPREKLMVVDWGAFRYIRHPLYLASLCFYLGLFFLTFSLASGLIFLIIFLFYNFIAGYEEKLLQQKLGKAYTNYMSKTGKWIPRLRSHIKL